MYSEKSEIIFSQKNTENIIKKMPRKIQAKESNFYKNFKKQNFSLKKAVKYLYKFTDEINKHITPFTPCRKGCSSCCSYYPIDVSRAEAELISEHYNLPIKGKYKGGSSNSKTCPLLIDGGCSVYNMRPYQCRKHHITTRSNKWCDTDKYPEHKFAYPVFSEPNRVYLHIVENLQNKDVDVKDIRQWFD